MLLIWVAYLEGHERSRKNERPRAMFMLQMYFFDLISFIPLCRPGPVKTNFALTVAIIY